VTVSAFEVGSDVGGTFTDLWVRADTGRTVVTKAPSTSDIISGVVAAVELAAGELALDTASFCARITRFGHGTTVGLNALLTSRYDRTAVITTRGFADTLEIGRLRRQAAGMTEAEVTDYYRRGRWTPLVAREDIVEVDERVDVAGEIVRPLDESEARAAVESLSARGVRAVAVCTLWSTVNGTHERRLRELVHDVIPDASVSLSHEVSHSVGEYARMTTTAANAALRRVAGDYVTELERQLRELGCPVPVMLMTGAGGVVPGAYLRERPVAALFSGPAAGVTASQHDAGRIGHENVLTIDIGGTSFDVGVVVGRRPLMSSEVRLAGAEIRAPTVDVRSIGAGGGSIASVHGGELRVGPASAGADPGPACYGRGGTRPTATDADLVLGVLDPGAFVGGRMRLDVDAAHAAIRTAVAEPLGVSVVRAAWGIRKVLASKMADLLRQVTIERGQDPRDFVMFAAGGSGPSHAVDLARDLGIETVVVPPTATAQSAYGSGTSDLLMTAERTLLLRLPPGRATTPAQYAALGQAVRDATAEVTAAMPVPGMTETTYAIRYGGQSHHIDVPADSLEEALRQFEAEYERLFGRGAAFPEAGHEVVSVRVTASAQVDRTATAPQGATLRAVNSRQVVFDDPDAPLATSVYAVEWPSEGQCVAGPSLIEFPGHTVVVPPGWQARSDTFGNIVLKRT
jgi:N-methylhydantoinase A